MSSQPVDIFVGRQGEMERLIGAFGDSVSSRGRLVMLAGESGIGKTRTAQELAIHAQTQGAQVLWGRCYDSEGAPPYWPWVQLLHEYILGVDLTRLQSELGPGSEDIAEIIPELRDLLTGLGHPPTLEPQRARFRLFESIAKFLCNAAQSQPLMLVLDDLHWADQPSLMMLQYLVRRIAQSRILLLGCYRDMNLSRQHPLSETLAQLSREPVFLRETLRGLDLEDTARFIQSATDGPPSHDLVEAIYSHTEGNPFFTSEVIRLLSDRGELGLSRTGNIGSIRIPEGVREVIGQRLNRLSESCNRVLTMASVIGREFEFRLLRVLDPEKSEEALLETVDEAAAARLIEELPGSIDRYRFSHALVQQTLSEELTTSRRVRLHARVALALEDLYGDEADAHAAELAQHFAEAEAHLGPDKMVRFSLAAGNRALAAYAFEEALVHFDRALEARDGQPMDDELADLLFGKGLAMSVTLERYQVHEAVETLSLSFDHYVKVNNVTQAVAVANTFLPALASHRTGMVELLSRALTVVAPGSLEAGRLLALYGRLKGHQDGDYESAQKAFDEALEIAEREGDAGLEMQILAAGSYVDFFHLHHQGCIEKTSRVLELGRQVDDPAAQVLALFGSVHSHVAVGNLAEGSRHAAACLEAGERFRDRYWLAGALLRSVAINMWHGNWILARELSDRSLELSDRDPRVLGTRVMLESCVGETEQAGVFMQRLIETRRLTSAIEEAGAGNAYTACSIAAAARMANVHTGLRDPKEAADTLLSSEIATPLFRKAANVGLALISVIEKNSEAARRQYDTLLPHKGTFVTQVGTTIDRALGLLCHTMGDFNLASTHFDDALAFCQKAGYRPELAWTCHDYAETLLQRNGQGDQDLASALMEEALDISTELGMRPLMEMVTALKDTLGTQPTARTAFPDGLTQREVEVIRLVAAGNTDREIAEELIISVNTVGNHVRSILNKTSAANRTEAAAYAALRGLTTGAGESSTNSG